MGPPPPQRGLSRAVARFLPNGADDLAYASVFC